LQNKVYIGLQRRHRIFFPPSSDVDTHYYFSVVGDSN
jgi:hypothetical protein